jgi:hypothetical protein
LDNLEVSIPKIDPSKRFVILYFKKNGQVVRMTKLSSQEACKTSIARYDIMGIKPCKIVEVPVFKMKKLLAEDSAD